MFRNKSGYFFSFWIPFLMSFFLSQNFTITLLSNEPSYFSILFLSNLKSLLVLLLGLNPHESPLVFVAKLVGDPSLPFEVIIYGIHFVF